MNVEDLKALLQDLPDDMVIIMPAGEGIFLTICKEASTVQEVKYPDAEAEEMLVLYPCECNEDDCDTIKSQINLN